jgi:hypothetical protein
MTDILIDLPGLKRSIETLFAWLQLDEEGNEGVAAFCADNQWYPMIGADWERVRSLRPMAERIARLTGRPMRLVRFRVREEVETLGIEVERSAP